MYNNNITDDGAIALTDALEYTLLELLDITENKISNYLVTKLRNNFAKNLLKIDELGEMPLKEKIVSSSEFHTYLEILSTKCYEKSIETWINQKKITILKFYNNDTQKIKILSNILKKNRTLTSFDIYMDVELKLDDKPVFQDIEVKAIADALKTNTTLTDLSIEFNTIGNIGINALIDALQINKTLLQLNLTGNIVDSKEIEKIKDVLKTNIKLTNLKLYLKKSDKIELLELRNTTIPNLPALPILERNTKIEIENVIEFRKYLKKLDTKCYKNYIQSLIDQLKITKLNFEKLNFDNINNNKLPIIFGQILKTNTTLDTLNLSGYHDKDMMMVDLGAIELAEALETNTTLTDLILDNNKIGDEGAKAIAEALKTNTTLINLKLSTNIIGDEGAYALAEALKTNTTLTDLILDNNKIGDEGAKAIAEALKTNTTLINLKLSTNIIGDEGANALAEALKTNTTTKLNLDNNRSSKLSK